MHPRQRRVQPTRRGATRDRVLHACRRPGVPGSKCRASLAHPTPGISHDNPTFRRYYGCVVLGADSRAAMDEILTSKQVADLVADQHTVMTAVHAFTVEHTEPVIGTGRPPPVRP